jgi:hypothetical protein
VRRIDSGDDGLLKLADNLRELELVVGERARPVVASVRNELRQAVACRTNGDVSGALALIRQAMDRLASLGTELDREEGAMMRAIARRFSEALTLGDKATAKETVSVMRRKAGDTKDEGDW